MKSSIWREGSTWPGFEGVEGLDSQAGPPSRPAAWSRACVLPGSTGTSAPGSSGPVSMPASITKVVTPGHCGPVQEGPLHRRCAPVGGQEREVSGPQPRPSARGGQHREKHKVAEGWQATPMSAPVLVQPPRQLGVSSHPASSSPQPGRPGGRLAAAEGNGVPPRRSRRLIKVTRPPPRGREQPAAASSGGTAAAGGRQVDPPHARPAEKACRA